ncbi:hypothetical protein NLG97_g2558 [Lecanicillium saksenae]|uniref:Uncharacterized protein n=1 Tax=Lecanicillium saksenae TaxID=468837 RepID=A0ACC1R2F7_9HYPO|nr:hypothetical protein NLG97_g2558 [Lecanicillium saksenae]
MSSWTFSFILLTWNSENRLTPGDCCWGTTRYFQGLCVSHIDDTAVRRSSRIAATSYQAVNTGGDKDIIVAEFSDLPGTRTSGLSGQSASSYGATVDTEKNKDEQFANAALIAFAAGFTIFDLGGLGRWTCRRKAFHLRNANDNNKVVYQSLVDGVYEVACTVNAIIEVKPFCRYPAVEETITMQEASEMSCWISDYPPLAMSQISNNGRYSRLLVSQDKHQIYLTVCTFKDTYVQYISGKMSPSEVQLSRKSADGFMTMTREGPYNTYDSDHMNTVRILLLAFSMKCGLW